ncbi:hypothetical protein [Vreelandella maris]|uniref:hypothetical protein n=1 Tax=Vreelandella maris TaxID=2729617 RepID=UPI0030ECD798
MKHLLGSSVISMALLTGCTGIPEGTEPVSDFALDRYLGQWYEIARRSPACASLQRSWTFLPMN